MIYWYELLFRGISPGSYPRAGFVTHETAHTNKRGFTFGAIAYDRKLSDKEVYDYELREIHAPRELEDWERSIIWTRRD